MADIPKIYKFWYLTIVLLVFDEEYQKVDATRRKYCNSDFLSPFVRSSDALANLVNGKASGVENMVR